jgi:hypothetical protein
MKKAIPINPCLSVVGVTEPSERVLPTLKHCAEFEKNYLCKAYSPADIKDSITNFTGSRKRF